MECLASGTGPRPVVTVLSVSPIEDDHASLQAIFDRPEWGAYTNTRWTLQRSVTVNSALSQLQRKEFPLVVAECDLPPVSWKELLAEIAGLPHRPLLVVTSRLADDYLWAEALNLGVHDVLAKPFDGEEVIRVFALGWLRWSRERERHRSRTKTVQVAAG